MLCEYFALHCVKMGVKCKIYEASVGQL